MTRTLHGLGHLLLELLRSTRQAAGKDLTLLVKEFLEELPVLVIHVFDAELLEAAVFLFLDVDRYRVEVTDFRLCLVLLCHGLLLLFVRKFCTTLLRVFHGELVLLESKETDDALVAAVLRFERAYERAFARELDQEVKTGGLLLNRVGELAKAPRLLVHNLTAVLGDDTLEFVSDLLHLCIGQNRRDNENGFVIVHNTY